jgi:hypothetical protein
MDVTDWAGTVFFVRATFRRTRTFGLVGLLPEDATRTHVFVTTSVPQGRWLLWRLLIDPLAAYIRRHFIYKFLEPDVARSAGIRYDPAHLIEADRLMAGYFAWLHRLHPRSVPPPADACA